LLASREHSTSELRIKLLKRGFEAETIKRVLAGLADRNLVSDVRFVESFLGARMRKGFGPLRIHTELRERGVDDRLIAQQLDRDEETWMALLAEVHRKKFGEHQATGRAELARQARFLEYRGFTTAQVSRFLRDDD
jgi:regulatory protein